MTILQEIAEFTKRRYADAENTVHLNEIKARARAMDNSTGFPFERALAKRGVSYICEVKKASPSRGIIAQDFPYVQIARDYEEAGASAISCLTEPNWFKGKNQYLTEISQNVSIPVLRKDFTVCPYQIYEAKVIGASAVLLICSLLSQKELEEYIGIAHSLGMSALAEAHTPEEVRMAIDSGAKIIGVNNRNLKDFTVDLGVSISLRSLVPPEILFVGESGIKTNEDIKRLRNAGVDGVLIGEALMTSKDKKQALTHLNGGEPI